MKTKTWLKAALIRAVKTLAQTAVAVLGSNQLGVLDADWTAALSLGGMAAVLSLLTSLAGLPEAPDR